MNRLIIFAFFTLISHHGFSQEYIDKIVLKSCECLDNIPDSTDAEQFNMELGICIIEASLPYKKQLKKDYDIDMDNLIEEGEKLGQIIGVKLVSICPDSFRKITQLMESDEEQVEHSEYEAKGIISKIENDFFVTFSIKDPNGKTAKYYWLTFVSADFELENDYTSLMGKSVKVSYEIQEFYDPKIEEYRQFFILTKMALSEEE